VRQLATTIRGLGVNLLSQYELLAGAGQRLIEHLVESKDELQPGAFHTDAMLRIGRR
jgi:hypothetical protein